MSQPPPPPNQPPPPPGQPPQGGSFGPQQPPQGGGFGAPAQPGPYGAPQVPGPYTPPQYSPYGPGPGMYPPMPAGGGAPGGSGGGGNGNVIAIIAAAAALVVVAAVGGWFLLGGGSSGKEAGPPPDNKPGMTKGKQLLKVETPDLGGERTLRLPGAWATGSVFAKPGIGSVKGYDAKTGSEKWTVPLSGTVCSAAKELTADHKAIVMYGRTRSDDAPCSRLGVVDLERGKLLWQTDVPGTKYAIGGGFDIAISRNVAAVQWPGGSAAYPVADSKPAKPLWHSKPGYNDCRDEGFAGGEELVAVVACGDYSDPDMKVQKVNPRTGQGKWEFEVPSGVKSVQVASVDPMVLVVGAGASSVTDVMTVGDDAELKGKISLGEGAGKKYDPGCSSGTESCMKIAADDDFVYMPTPEHQGSSGYSPTNEIMAFHFNDGKEAWKSPGGEGRSIVPLRMEDDKLLAYKMATLDDGGQVVAIDPKTKKQEPLLQNPAETAGTERDFAGITMRDAPIYEHGRLFLHDTLLSKPTSGLSDYGKYMAIGFGKG